jgi:hypothetical protein
MVVGLPECSSIVNFADELGFDAILSRVATPSVSSQSGGSRGGG